MGGDFESFSRDFNKIKELFTSRINAFIMLPSQSSPRVSTNNRRNDEERFTKLLQA